MSLAICVTSHFYNLSLQPAAALCVDAYTGVKLSYKTHNEKVTFSHDGLVFGWFKPKSVKEEVEHGEDVGEESRRLVEELGARQTAARIERPEMKPKVEGKTRAKEQPACRIAGNSILPSKYMFPGINLAARPEQLIKAEWCAGPIRGQWPVTHPDPAEAAPILGNPSRRIVTRIEQPSSVYWCACRWEGRCACIRPDPPSR